MEDCFGFNNKLINQKEYMSSDLISVHWPTFIFWLHWVKFLDRLQFFLHGWAGRRTQLDAEPSPCLVTCHRPCLALTLGELKALRELSAVRLGEKGHPYRQILTPRKTILHCQNLQITTYRDPHKYNCVAGSTEMNACEISICQELQVSVWVRVFINQCMSEYTDINMYHLIYSPQIL